MQQLIRDTDPAFVRWALGAIVNWDCKDFSGDYIHIHGSGDLILPMKYTKPTHIIKKAGHLMVLTQAIEINNILQAVLKKHPYNPPHP